MSVAFDEAKLLDRIDDDIEFLDETVTMLEEDCPPLQDNLRSAVATGDIKAMTLAAHTLKGLFANFCAGPALDVAGKLETMGREGRIADAGSSVAVLDAESEKLITALRAFVQARTS